MVHRIYKKTGTVSVLTSLLGVETDKMSSSFDPTSITLDPFVTPASRRVNASLANPLIMSFCIVRGTPGIHRDNETKIQPRYS